LSSQYNYQNTPTPNPVFPSFGSPVVERGSEGEEAREGKGENARERKRYIHIYIYVYTHIYISRLLSFLGRMRCVATASVRIRKRLSAWADSDGLSPPTLSHVARQGGIKAYVKMECTNCGNETE
jgi:hypothetical protein